MKVTELIVELATRIKSLESENELLKWENKNLKKEIEQVKENSDA